MIHWIRGLLAFIIMLSGGLILFQSKAHASIQPTQTYGQYSCTVDGMGTATGTSADAACRAVFNATHSNLCPNFTELTGNCNSYDSFTGSSILWHQDTYCPTSVNCGGGVTGPAFMYSNGTITVPASTVGVGQPTLSCPNGYTLQNNVCEQNAPPPTCPNGGTPSGGVEGNGNGSGTISVGGCGVDCSTVVTAGGAFGGSGCKYTGQPAPGGAPTGSAYNPENTPTAGGCMSQGKGYVTSSTGATTCVAMSDQPPSNPITKTNSDTSKTNGVPTTTSTSVNCAGGDCTVTKAVTDANGQTTTTEQSKGTFCSENPNSSICKDFDMGSPTDDVSLGTLNRGMDTLPSVSFASNNSCPADVQLPKGAVFKWTPICDAMGWLRPVVLAMAYLSAALLLVGALKAD